MWHNSRAHQVPLPSLTLAPILGPPSGPRARQRSSRAGTHSGLPVATTGTSCQRPIRRLDYVTCYTSSSVWVFRLCVMYSLQPLFKHGIGVAASLRSARTWSRFFDVTIRSSHGEWRTCWETDTRLGSMRESFGFADDRFKNSLGLNEDELRFVQFVQDDQNAYSRRSISRLYQSPTIAIVSPS
jgi:hypothetical protein